MATIQKSNAVQFGWGNVKSDLRFFIIITLIYVAILVIVGAIFDNFMSIKMNNNTKISFNVVSWVINSILTIGFMKISLNYVDNKKSNDISEIFSGFSSGRVIGNYLLASFLYGLICLVGLILLVLPGIIWSIKYSYTLYLVVDKNMNAVQAIKMSGKITNGFKIDLCIFGLLLFCIAVLGVLCLGVGIFVALPVIFLANAYVYRQLLNE